MIMTSKSFSVNDAENSPRKMDISATAIISEETNKEMKRISMVTGKRLSWLYKEAIEEYVRNHGVLGLQEGTR